MDYNAPSGSTDPNAPFVGKTASTQGSKVPPKAAEYPQREIVNAERVAGLTPSNGDLTQLAGALGRGLWLGTLALTLGTTNVLAGTLGAPGAGATPGFIQTLPAWTKLRGFTTQSNNATTVNVTIAGVGSANGTVSGPLLRRDGQPLAVGDVPAGPIEFQPDGSGNFRLVAVAPSEMIAITAQAPTGKGLFSKATGGSYTWTVPAGVYWVYATCVGGGGGGSGGLSSGAVTAGAGGGAGGTAAGWIAVTPGQVIPYVVGFAGAGTGYQALGNPGGTSSVGSVLQATGGFGASNGTATAGGGGGSGSGSACQLSLIGGNGGDGNFYTANAPGGQGGASSLGGGGRASTFFVAGVSNGAAPGSGGGGLYGNGGAGNGGSGAMGYVSFQY